MSIATSADTARLLIESDLDHVEKLISLLQEERSALEARDIPRLQEAVQNKMALLSALEANARQRDRQLKQLRLDTGPRGWHDHLERLVNEQAPELREKWQRLLEKLQQCAELTEINSRIVSRTQHSIGQVLDLMRGQSGASAAVYDKLGRSRKHFDNRPITSA